MTSPLLFFLFGLIVGSFLNVCIYRLPIGMSIVHPRSRCTGCGHILSWYENVPVLSYAALAGRCRTCGARISWQYPIIELTTACIFALGAWQFEPGALLASRLVFASALVVLFVIDLQHRILPNSITIPGVAIGFLFSVFVEPGWSDSLIGIALGGGALFAVAEAYYHVRHEQGLGMGDVKMLAMIGAFLGWKLMLLTLVLASFAGSAIGIGLIVARKGTMKYALPFGTFLALGALIAAFVGDPIVQWYSGFYR